MMSAFQQFLKTNPKHLRTITVVVYNDAGLVDRFAAAMMQMFPQNRSGKTSNKFLRAITFVGRTISRGASALSQKIQPRRRAANTNAIDSDASQDRKAKQQVTGDRFNVTVCVTRIQDLKTVKDILMEEIKVNFLWHETLRDNKAHGFHTLPFHITEEIADMAVKKNVLLSARGRSVQLCGRKDKVQGMLLMIGDKIQDQGTDRNSREKSRRQKLGLPVDTDHLPHYWRVCRSNPKVTYEQATYSWTNRGTGLNSVSPEIQAAVAKVVYDTWESSKVGAGVDASNLCHSRIKVVKVERLENPQLWKQYSHKREELLGRLEQNYKAASRPLGRFGNSSGPVQTTANIAAGSPLCQGVYQQVNEHYLFHGTKEQVLSRIFSEGLDDRLTEKAMLGKDVYTAESSTKADQYADHADSRSKPGTQLKMMLIRVLLGEIYLYTDPNPEPFLRPPCFTCKRRHDDCSCRESDLFHSVVYDSSKLFREFVVYDRHLCYPEYIITYIRK